MWYFDKVMMGELDSIKQRIRIEELLDKAEKSVFDNASFNYSIKS
jgi:hypothetical protein